MLIFTTTRNESSRNGVKILGYGKAGVGKTCLCATLPRPLIASAEAGLLSLRRIDIPVCKIKTVKDLSDLYEWCCRSTEARLIDSICLDSITEIAEAILANAKPQVKDPRQAYGLLLEQTMALIRSFRDLPEKNVYFAAKMEYVKDEMSGAMKFGPMMPGQKLGQQLPYLFDEVFYMGVGKTQQGVEYRFLQTKADFQHEAKDRSGSLDSIEYPDLGQIIRKIQGV